MVTQAKIPCHAYSITKTYLIMFNKFVIELIWMKNYKAHNIRYLICINEVKLPLNMHILTNWKHMIATFPSLKKVACRGSTSNSLVILQCVDTVLCILEVHTLYTHIDYVSFVPSLSYCRRSNSYNVVIMYGLQYCKSYIIFCIAL